MLRLIGIALTPLQKLQGPLLFRNIASPSLDLNTAERYQDDTGRRGSQPRVGFRCSPSWSRPSIVVASVSPDHSQYCGWLYESASHMYPAWYMLCSVQTSTPCRILSKSARYPPAYRLDHICHWRAMLPGRSYGGRVAQGDAGKSS